MKVLKLPDVMKACALSRSTIYAYIARNKFPIQITLGEKSVGWDEDEINNWLKQKADARPIKTITQKSA